MITVHDVNGAVITSVKGAPERVLAGCAAPERQRLEVEVDRLASAGRRVLAVADAPGADLTGSGGGRSGWWPSAIRCARRRPGLLPSAGGPVSASSWLRATMR